MRAILAVACAVLLIPAISSAHGSGLSFTATSAEYSIDIGYDPGVFETDMATVFDFLLWRGAIDTGLPADYDHVWVRIISDKSTIFAAGIAQQRLGPTTLMYVFEKPGEYTMIVSFRDAQGKTIASAEMPLSVVRADKESSGYSSLVLALAVFLFVAAAFAVGRRSTARRLQVHDEF